MEWMASNMVEMQKLRMEADDPEYNQAQWIEKMAQMFQVAQGEGNFVTSKFLHYEHRCTVCRQMLVTFLRWFLGRNVRTWFFILKKYLKNVTNIWKHAVFIANPTIT